MASSCVRSSSDGMDEVVDLFEAEDDVGVGKNVFLLASAVTCGKYCQQGHPGWEVEITRPDEGTTSDTRR